MNSKTLCLVIATVATTLLCFFINTSFAASLTAGSPKNNNNNGTTSNINDHSIAGFTKDCPKLPDHVLKCLVEQGFSAAEMAAHSGQLMAVLCCPSSPLRDCLVGKLFADPSCHMGGITPDQMRDFHSSDDCRRNVATTTTSEEACRGPPKHQHHSGAAQLGNSSFSIPLFALLAVSLALFAGN